MKKVQLFLLVLSALVLTTVSAQETKGKKETPKEVTITGTITDLKCYLTGMSTSGDDHKQCAIDCINGGLPVGILDEKTSKAYVLVPKPGMKGANGELVKYAEQKVKLTGTFVERSGQKMFFYTKVEESK